MEKLTPAEQTALNRNWQQFADYHGTDLFKSMLVGPNGEYITVAASEFLGHVRPPLRTDHAAQQHDQQHLPYYLSPFDMKELLAGQRINSETVSKDVYTDMLKVMVGKEKHDFWRKRTDRAFTVLDVGKDNLVGKDEFRSTMTSGKGPHFSTDELEDLFRRMQNTKEGEEVAATVDLDQFDQWANPPTPPPPPPPEKKKKKKKK